MKSHTIRLIVASTVGAFLMLILLLMAVKYAQRDWNRKNQRARSSTFHQADSAGSTESDATKVIEGWTCELPPEATQRMLDRLVSPRKGPNGWLLLGRALPEKSESEHALACLRMAMASEGESAKIRNDLGAVYLQQNRIRNAIAEFRAADQIEPGFAPARYNLALCAISLRDPNRGIHLLGQYLAQRPEDTTALRLQATLLTQLDRPQEALRMLENYLKSQPANNPLFLEAASLAARLGQNGNAVRYLETALNGNSIRTVIRTYQSPAFRSIRLSEAGEDLTARMARKARVTFSTPIPVEEIRPLRSSSPTAIVR